MLDVTNPMMAVVLATEEELLAVEIQSNSGGAVGRGHLKGLLTIEVEAVKNTDKTRLQDTRKLEQWL